MVAGQMIHSARLYWKTGLMEFEYRLELMFAIVVMLCTMLHAAQTPGVCIAVGLHYKYGKNLEVIR